VPETGRRRLLLTSPEFEAAQGAQAFAQITEKEEVLTDRQLNEMVQRVGQRLAAVVDEDTPGDYEWRFAVIKSDQANAFALPGGKVAIYTGILPYCQNEAGLATVMGHEIAHAVARHGGERVSQGVLIAGVGTALQIVLENNDVEPTEQNIWLAAFGLGAQLGVLLPYSRTHELEADYMGLLYMARAGYDPREAPEFWQRMAEVGQQPPEWLSTHPDPSRRIDDLQDAMPEALQVYQKNEVVYGDGNLIPQPWRTLEQQSPDMVEALQP
jgi:predicted Zn-dependent protease